jgi:UPF0755 protein
MHRHLKHISKQSRSWLLLGLAALAIFLGGLWALRSWYTISLRPVSSSMTSQYFTVETGSGVHQIAVKLKRANLIRSPKAFETYVRGNELHDQLQAGTYSLRPSMDVQQIVKKMVDGDVAKNLLTILPGKRLGQIKQAFVKSGYSSAEINSAFDPVHYSGHPALASLPAGASLEGYLYPDSFQKESDTPAQIIVRESLDEMQKRLSANVVAGFKNQSLSTFQAITLASIIQQETDDPDAQPTVAQVFLLRLNRGMALQSNVTANYAADIAGKPRSINIKSSYNTYLHKGLTPGPIGNVTISALSAVARPSHTDYLYFVAGDDDKIHFSHTAQEHSDQIDRYCRQKCLQP